MWYILPKKNSFGAYPNPQNLKCKGMVELPENLLSVFVENGGFVELEVEGETVVSVTPDAEAYEAWKALQTEQTPAEDPAKDDVVTWSELDAAYNEGRDSAYDL